MREGEPILRNILALLVLLGASLPVQAARLEKHEDATTGTCALTCSTRQGTDDWHSVRQCFERMTQTQCDALADHRNKSDAYPSRMKCEARITEPCAASR